MDTAKENEFWKWVNQKFDSFREEFKRDSRAEGLRDPADLNAPPLPPRLKELLKKGEGRRARGSHRT